MREYADSHILVALENTKLCVWRRAASTGYVEYYPENAANVFGLSFENLPRSAEETLALVHPEDRARVAEAFERANKDGSRHEIEYRLIGPHQTILYLNETSQPEFDQAGWFTGNFGTLQNVTERCRAEEELRESEKRLSHAVQIARLGYWVWDEVEDKILSCSEEFAQILGYSHPDEVIPLLSSPEEHIKRVYPDDRTRYTEIVKKAAHAREGFDVEYRILTPAGEVRHVREIAEVEFGIEGRLSRTRGTLQDVTERLRLESELRLRERELSQAQRLGKIGHWLLDLKKQEFTFWSDELYRIFGVGRDSFHPTIENFHAAIHKDDLQRSIANRKAALAEKRSYSFEYRIVRPDGEIRIIRGEARPEFDEAGNPSMVFGITQDVTEARQRELALRHAQKMEAIGQLTGGIAHDFNNLLAVIMGNAELLAKEAEADNPKLQVIIRSSIRGGELTQRLLAFSRQQPLRPQSIDLAALMAGMSALLKPTLGETVDMVTVRSPDLWPVLADPGQLESALLNLAINARDAMPEGGKLTIECMNVSLDAAYAEQNPEAFVGDYVVMAVSDTGVGMPDQVREHAFEPFFTTKEVGKGSGLGLSMIYGFAKQSGGHVSVSSKVGEGTTVKLFLPRSRCSETIQPQPVSDEVAHARGETVFLVEDDPDVRSLVSGMLRDLGYQVMAATVGAAALEMMAAEPIADLLLTDVVLPGGMSGYQLAAEAERCVPGIKVVYMSGYTRNQIAHHGRRLEPDADLLQKPFSEAVLAQALRRALDS